MFEMAVHKLLSGTLKTGVNQEMISQNSTILMGNKVFSNLGKVKKNTCAIEHSHK